MADPERLGLALPAGPHQRVEVCGVWRHGALRHLLDENQRPLPSTSVCAAAEFGAVRARVTRQPEVRLRAGFPICPRIPTLLELLHLQPKVQLALPIVVYCVLLRRVAF